MRTVTVQLKERSYKIIVGAGALVSLGQTLKRLALGSCAYVVTNPTIWRRHGPRIISSLKHSGVRVVVRTIADAETSKSFDTVTSLIAGLNRQARRERLFIVACGGGVVGDVAGFAAAIFRRGIPYVQVPTTLLAQVDSAIGGKTAVDLTEGKNLAGAFYQPRLVVSDVRVLETLPLRQLRSGLAEIIKYGVISDPQLFEYVEAHVPALLAAGPRQLTEVIMRSSAIKAKVVAEDEREEKGKRTVLNFGHTIGHALEAASGYCRFSHGEAISLGMVAAGIISREMGLVSCSPLQRLEGLLKRVGLPVRMKGVSVANVVAAHYYDKKFTGGTNRFVLLRGIGRVEVVEHIPLGVIRQALRSIAYLPT